jgi:PAS domain S-box-containing protein
VKKFVEMTPLQSRWSRIFAAAEVHEDIDAWRNYVLSVILLATAILGSVAAVPSIAISIYSGLWSIAIADSLALAWVIVIWRARSLSYRLRAWSFCIIIYLLGTLLMAKVGHAAQIYLMAFPVMAALLLGPKPAIIALIVNAVTLLTAGYLLDADIYLTGFDLSPMAKWGVITVNFLAINLLITFATVVLLSGLEKSLNLKRESELRYRMLTEWSLAPMGVQRDGKIVYANQASVRMLGANSAQDLIGKSLIDFVHPDSRPIVMERMKNAMERGMPAPMMEEKIVKLDGTILDAEVQSAPIVYDGSSAVQVAIHDITERKRAQAERDSLERKLQQAQKMEAVGNLTGGIAHDFNNLLAVIIGRLDMVRSELEDRPEVRGWVDACMKAAGRGAALTRSMLAFSRRQSLQTARVDVAVTLREIVGLLKRTLGAGIEIKEVYQPEMWECVADPAQLQTALLNLAFNARDGMPEGGKLTIEARNIHLDDEAARQAEVTKGDFIAVSVTDTGVGMPSEVIEHAFEPFFTTKEVGKGTGLGLSMVYGYVKQSGGHVKIYSEVGTGTTVRLYLPRFMPAQAAREEIGDRAKGTLEGGTEQILVVEDSAEMCALTVEQLERLGYRVFSASQGPDALPLLEEHPGISLVLTDMSLPGGMSGTRLAERAREIRPDLKILYMSGYSKEAMVHQGRLDSSIRLLQKPFAKDDLAVEVRAALAGV